MKRTNGSYEIIDSFQIDKRDMEVVIGKNSFEYVCWYCVNGNDYHTGYYSSDYQDVRDKFIERIK